MNLLSSCAVALAIAGIGLMLVENFFDLGLVLLIEGGVLATLLSSEASSAMRAIAPKR